MRKILMLLLVLGMVAAGVGVVTASDNNTTDTSGDNNNTGSSGDNNNTDPSGDNNNTDPSGDNNNTDSSGDNNSTTPTPTTPTPTTTLTPTPTATSSPKIDLDVSINANVTSGKIPLTVNFTAVVNDSLVKSYKWEVHKDESYKNGRSVEFTYKEVGEYTVTLIVEPNDSSKYNKVEKTVKITVTEEVLDASFTASPTSGNAPLTVKFTDTSSGATDWAWSIYKTDGGSRTLQSEMGGRNTSYTFQNAGTYQVELLAKKGSNTSSEIQTITVNAKATTVPTTVRTTAATTAPTTVPTSPAVMAASLSADDELPLPNPMDVIDEFIRLLLAMMNPEKYNLEI